MQREKLTPEKFAARQEASQRLADKHRLAMAESLAKEDAEICGKAPRTPARNPLLEWA